MTERNDCIDELLKAIKDRKDRKFVKDRLEELDDRFEADDGPGSAREKYFRAAKEMLDEQAVQSAVLKRNLRMDALKFRDLRTYIEAAHEVKGGSYHLGIEARLVGVNTPFFDPKSRAGNQASVGSLSLGAQRDWIGGAIGDIQRLERDKPQLAGLEKLFYSKAIESEIFIEKVELERQAKGFGARPGRTKNEGALEIARILHKWDKTKIGALNEEGAWITEHSSYGASVQHDPDKMIAAGGNLTRRMFTRESNRQAFDPLFQEARMAWASKTLQWIDAKRTFGTTVDADKKLAEMYGGLVTGDHLEMTTVSSEPIFGNLARKVSASRELIWKSAEDQLAYMREFGRFGPTDAWLHGMRDSANKYALMKVFGSKPKENFEELLAYAKNRTTGAPERLTLDKWEQALRNRYAVVSGEADRPVRNAWSGIVAGVMAVQRLAKLGLTPFAMISDNVTISRELAYHGVNYLERNGGLLSGYFQGAPGTAKREVAELLHTGILGRLRGVTARFDVADGAPGIMAKLENTFFKITGISGMSENKRADAERMMAFHMGKQRGKDFAELGESETRILNAFGIGDREWALLAKTAWNEIDGATYLTPDVALKLKDADIQEYLKSRGSIADRAAAAVVAPQAPAAAADLVERTRHDLALKLWAYYGERGQFAVIEVGPRERAMLYKGTKPGEQLNLALRLLLQFKQFPTAMVSKVWGREINGGAGTMDKVAGITELVVGSTLAGMMANYLNDVAKGHDPHARWRNQPIAAMISGFTRGGAGTIYGDFLIGEWSRFGSSAINTLVGPTFGQVDKAMEIYSAITHPSKWKGTSAALGLRTARENLPFGNMIYTKAAIDYLVFYRLQEWLNPGYLERMERTVKEKQGIEFMLSPRAIAR